MEEIIIELFNLIKIKIEKISDLENIKIENTIFLQSGLKDKIKDMIPKIKLYWSSNYNNCLLKKAPQQRNFVLNVYRQLLKTYNYKFKAHSKAEGYEKNGKRIVKRWYTIYKVEKKINSQNNSTKDETGIDVFKFLCEKQNIVLHYDSYMLSHHNLKEDKFVGLNLNNIENNDNSNSLENNIENSNLLELEHKTLGTIIVIQVREDGYMDATAICQAGGKKFCHWYENNRTKKIIKELSLDTGFPSTKLILTTKGKGKNQHTFVHPILAISIAQWVSPKYHIKVCNYVLNIYIYGKCELGKEKSIIETQNDLVSKLKAERDKYKKKYEDNLKRKSRDKKNNQVNCIYILSNPLQPLKKIYKVGLTKNLKDRLSQYNTSTTCKEEEFNVEYSISFSSTSIAKAAEKLIHEKIDFARISANREWFKLDKTIIITELEKIKKVFSNFLNKL